MFTVLHSCCLQHSCLGKELVQRRYCYSQYANRSIKVPLLAIQAVKSWLGLSGTCVTWCGRHGTRTWQNRHGHSFSTHCAQLTNALCLPMWDDSPARSPRVVSSWPDSETCRFGKFFTKSLDYIRKAPGLCLGWGTDRHDWGHSWISTWMPKLSLETGQSRSIPTASPRA
jgi:hypothetical protein